MTDKYQLAENFADAANEFVELVSNPGSSPDVFARALLASLTRLYLAALALSAETDVELHNIEFLKVTKDDWLHIHRNVSGTIGEHDTYWITFDPIFPRNDSGDPCLASLGDDCADIYRDIIRPLSAFNAGQTEILDDIIWEWADTPFQSHWGLHAACAIHTLHWIVFPESA